jgi:hypothetical protein
VRVSAPLRGNHTLGGMRLSATSLAFLFALIHLRYCPRVDTTRSTTYANMCSVAPTLQYHPSAWESEWRSGHALEVTKNHSRHWSLGCSLMEGQPDTIRAWLDYAKLRRPTRTQKTPPSPLADWKHALSFHVVLDACTNHTLALIPIEPLVGFLRNPYTHCFQAGRNAHWALQRDKNYLIPSWRQDVWPRDGSASALLFDLGASLYNKGPGGASTSWFVDEYRARGIRFDRIFAWEAKPHDDTEIFAPVPNSVADRMSYYNVPVDSRVGAKHNPWRTLRAVATPRDFVVVKIDIDNSTVEEPLAQQLLADAALAGLVDELYFEHHVLHTPMWRYGWSVNTVTTHTLVDSYALFGQLREMGIRAHSWV